MARRGGLHSTSSSPLKPAAKGVTPVSRLVVAVVGITSAVAEALGLVIGVVLIALARRRRRCRCVLRCAAAAAAERFFANVAAGQAAWFAPRELSHAVLSLAQRGFRVRARQRGGRGRPAAVVF